MNEDDLNVSLESVMKADLGKMLVGILQDLHHLREGIYALRRQQAPVNQTDEQGDMK